MPIAPSAAISSKLDAFTDHFAPLPEPAGPCVYAAVLSLLILALGVVVDPVAIASKEAVDRFDKGPKPGQATLAQQSLEVRP